MIITICCEKGGVGKSSISQNLAVYLVKELKKDLILIDADPQLTTHEWVEERNELGEAVPIHCVAKTGNLVATLEDLAKRYEVVLVDTGGADSKAMRSALGLADKALIPFRPKRRDLKRAPHMSDLVETIKAHNTQLDARAILTQCPTLPSQQRRIDTAKQLLDSLSLNPLNAWICNRNAWDDSEENGLSVLEWEHEDKKAASEARAVFEEFLQ